MKYLILMIVLLATSAVADDRHRDNDIVDDIIRYEAVKGDEYDMIDYRIYKSIKEREELREESRERLQRDLEIMYDVLLTPKRERKKRD